MTHIAVGLGVLSASLALSVIAGQQPVQKEIECDRLVSYEELRGDLPGSVEIEQDPKRLVPTVGPREPSPQATAFFIVQRPDTTKPGPYSTTIDIHGNSRRPLSLRVRVVDHVYDVKVQWLNEKLLWVQMFRGRIRGIDSIVDVEKGTIVYQQEAVYADLIAPCHQARERK